MQKMYLTNLMIVESRKLEEYFLVMMKNIFIYIYIYMANYMFRNIEVKGPHVELVLSFLHVSFAIKLSL